MASRQAEAVPPLRSFSVLRATRDGSSSRGLRLGLGHIRFACARFLSPPDGIRLSSPTTSEDRANRYEDASALLRTGPSRHGMGSPVPQRSPTLPRRSDAKHRGNRRGRKVMRRVVPEERRNEARPTDLPQKNRRASSPRAAGRHAVSDAAHRWIRPRSHGWRWSRRALLELGEVRGLSLEAHAQRPVPASRVSSRRERQAARRTDRSASTTSGSGNRRKCIRPAPCRSCMIPRRAWLRNS